MAKRRVSRWVRYLQIRAAFILHHLPPNTRSLSRSLSGCGAAALETVMSATWALQTKYWLHQLVWSPSAVDRPASDVSWLELFWGFIYDASCLLPFRIGSAWVSLDDDVSFGFAFPPRKEPFSHMAVFVGCPCAWWPCCAVSSGVGARFVRPGISSLAVLPLEACSDFFSVC